MTDCSAANIAISGKARQQAGFYFGTGDWLSELNYTSNMAFFKSR